ncbi:F-box [Glarea lozoyensis ATCC 20868]|uniref:F-box n=1 Tax=Glarea lozoyensis (strain ATCC 20868 / MF5171) TaxID=1116229 RepID=S3DGY7_GLAL2|nr:F-box [Glarea lozoyensis ATCC 20868]EPE36975.1 F-box [Glarea lozoyensis ATCC 20868]
MVTKRRRSNTNTEDVTTIAKRARIYPPNDYLSALSSELLIRILHHLPIESLLLCQTISHRFYSLTSDSQIWKSLYYSRFVLPRALRIPGIKSAPTAEYDDALRFSSRRSKWLDDNTLINRKDGERTDWKKQYKLRHNWSIGACEVQEIRVRDRRKEAGMLVKLAEGFVITADGEDGLRVWNLKTKELVTFCGLEGHSLPSCIAVDEDDDHQQLGVAIGFEDGSWGTWQLDIASSAIMKRYYHPKSSNGLLSAIAYASPYILTITDSQILSLYTFDRDTTRVKEEPASDSSAATSFGIHDLSSLDESPEVATLPSVGVNEAAEQGDEPAPRLLASLKSHTCWPPVSLSIRLTPSTIIGSIAYSLPTYFSGYTVGLQELHLSPSTGLMTSSRLTSALPQGFSSILPTPLISSPTSSGASSPLPPRQSRASVGSTVTPSTSLSYAHPYILATHPDNTLSLYLCTSTSSDLSLSEGTKLWGHTSSVSSAEITSRGKAVSVSTRGNELRVWSLEGGFSSSTRSRKDSRLPRDQRRDRSVQIRQNLSPVVKSSSAHEFPKRKGSQEVVDADPSMNIISRSGLDEEFTARKHWVGFDDEVVIVLKEDESGSQALVVYDFT